MSVGFDQYKCDCTRTGFYGENCTTRKFVVECPHLEWGIYSYRFTELCLIMCPVNFFFFSLQPNF